MIKNCILYSRVFDPSSHGTLTPIFEVQIKNVTLRITRVSPGVIKSQIQHPLYDAIEVSNYEVCTSNPNVKQPLKFMRPSSWADTPIAAILESFVKLVFATSFPLFEEAGTFWNRLYHRLSWRAWSLACLSHPDARLLLLFLCFSLRVSCVVVSSLASSAFPILFSPWVQDAFATFALRSMIVQYENTAEQAMPRGERTVLLIFPSGPSRICCLHFVTFCPMAACISQPVLMLKMPCDKLPDACTYRSTFGVLDR